MSRRLVAAAVLLSAAPTGFAHRLDEYLQATMLRLEKGSVGAEIRLTPGVAVFPAVLASIDTDADRLISDGERTAYATRVLRDLSLTIDGSPVRLSLVSVQFAKTEEMKEGLGEIQLECRAVLPGGGPDRRIVFRNHHQSGMAAYLVNALVPRDPDIHLTSQSRSEDQSVYQLDYVQSGGVLPGPLSIGWWAGDRLWASAGALLLLARLGWLLRGRAWRVRPPVAGTNAQTCSPIQRTL
jgi:hypothetical protein